MGVQMRSLQEISISPIETNSIIPPHSILVLDRLKCQYSAQLGYQIMNAVISILLILSSSAKLNSIFLQVEGSKQPVSMRFFLSAYMSPSWQSCRTRKHSPIVIPQPLPKNKKEDTEGQYALRQLRQGKIVVLELNNYKKSHTLIRSGFSAVSVTYVR